MCYSSVKFPSNENLSRLRDFFVKWQSFIRHLRCVIAPFSSYHSISSVAVTGSLAILPTFCLN